MEDWGSIIGNGNGVIVFLNEGQISGSVYGDANYQAILTNAINNNYGFDAELSNGIMRNTPANKFAICKRIKDSVFKMQDSPTTFAYQYDIIAFNQTLTGQQTLQYMRDNNLAAFLALPDTKQLATTGTDFLNYFL